MWTHLQKWGNSQAVRIPKPLLESASFSENEQVQIIAEEGQIIIRKAKAPRRTLAQILEGYEGEYCFEECDWGNPIGDEVF